MRYTNPSCSHFFKSPNLEPGRVTAAQRSSQKPSPSAGRKACEAARKALRNLLDRRLQNMENLEHLFGWGTESSEVVNPLCHLGSGTKGEVQCSRLIRESN